MIKFADVPDLHVILIDYLYGLGNAVLEIMPKISYRLNEFYSDIAKCRNIDDFYVYVYPRLKELLWEFAEEVVKHHGGSVARVYEEVSSEILSQINNYFKGRKYRVPREKVKEIIKEEPVVKEVETYTPLEQLKLFSLKKEGIMKDAVDRYLEEILRENKKELRKQSKEKLINTLKKELDSSVSIYLSNLFDKELKADLNVLEVKPNERLIFDGWLYQDEYSSMPLKISAKINKLGIIEDYEILNIEDIKRKLGVEKYAIWLGCKDVYFVEAIDEKKALKKVLSNLFSRNRRILIGNRLYTEKDIDLLVDELYEKGHVLKWSDYIKKEKQEEEKEEENIPIIYEYDIELKHLQSIPQKEVENVIDELLKDETEIHKHIYSVLQLKRQVASIIENDLAQYGIDAVVDIRNFDENELYKKGVCKGIADIYSSYVNASVPFIVSLDEDGLIKEVSYRDKEIIKSANLKVYSLLIDGKEIEILATGIPIVLETAKKIFKRNVSVDELVEKYMLKEKGEFSRLIDDSKEVNPWRVINTSEGDYLVNFRRLIEKIKEKMEK